MKKKLGVHLQTSIIRYDVIKFLQTLSQFYDIYILEKEVPEGRVENKLLLEFKTLKYKQSFSLTYKLLKFLYDYFGYIPLSVNNYKVVHYFAQSKVNSRLRRFLVHLKFQITLKMPKFFSYDNFLNSIQPQISMASIQLDKLLLFTHIEDDQLLSFLLKSKTPLFIYLYSWDHSCKLKRLPKNANYFVWTQEVGEDLSYLNNISKAKIKCVGATQLALIKEFQNRKTLSTEVPKTRYILFAFSTMYDKLIEDEIRFLFFVLEIFNSQNWNIKILVRAYPNVKSNEIYDSLKKNDSFIFFDPTGNKLNDWESISCKYHQIENALAFFHFGTTLGLEACFFETPVFLIDFYDFAINLKDAISLKKFVHQYQNDKYLNLLNSPNVIKNKGQLMKILKDLVEERDFYYKDYSIRIRQQFELKSMEEIALCTNNLME
jgi:hypothetical protein